MRWVGLVKCFSRPLLGEEMRVIIIVRRRAEVIRKELFNIRDGFVRWSGQLTKCPSIWSADWQLRDTGLFGRHWVRGGSRVERWIYGKTVTAFVRLGPLLRLQMYVLLLGMPGTPARTALSSTNTDHLFVNHECHAPFGYRTRQLLHSINEEGSKVMPTCEYVSPPHIMEQPRICSPLGKQRCLPQLSEQKFITHLASHNAAAVPVYTDGTKSATGVGFAAVYLGKVVSGKLPHPPYLQLNFAPSFLLSPTCSSGRSEGFWYVHTLRVLRSLSSTPSHCTLLCE